MRLSNYSNPEETERALDNNQVPAKYTGKTKTLENTRGECYFNVHDDRWYYRPIFKSDTLGILKGDWTRVHESNLEFI